MTCFVCVFFLSDNIISFRFVFFFCVFNTMMLRAVNPGLVEMEFSNAVNPGHKPILMMNNLSFDDVASQHDHYGSGFGDVLQQSQGRENEDGESSQGVRDNHYYHDPDEQVVQDFPSVAPTLSA